MVHPTITMSPRLFAVLLTYVEVGPISVGAHISSEAEPKPPHSLLLKRAMTDIFSLWVQPSFVCLFMIIHALC